MYSALLLSECDLAVTCDRRLVSWLKFTNHLAFRKMRIAVEGNIGCGKSTFLEWWSVEGCVPIAPEPVEQWKNLHGHNLLRLAYEDPKRWTMAFQTYVQLSMFQRAHAHVGTPLEPTLLAQERSVWSAQYVFVENALALGNLSQADVEVLRELHEFHVDLVPSAKVDHIVYLRCAPEIAYARIHQRGRPEEANISLDYLKQIHELYDKWLLKGERPTHNAKIHVVDNSLMTMDDFEAAAADTLQKILTSVPKLCAYWNSIS